MEPNSTFVSTQHNLNEPRLMLANHMQIIASRLFYNVIRLLQCEHSNINLMITTEKETKKVASVTTIIQFNSILFK